MFPLSSSATYSFQSEEISHEFITIDNGVIEINPENIPTYDIEVREINSDTSKIFVFNVPELSPLISTNRINNQVAVANYIMERAGYTDVENYTDDFKRNFISGDQIIVQSILYEFSDNGVTIHNPDMKTQLMNSTNSTNTVSKTWITSTLSATRRTTRSYYMSNTCVMNGVPRYSLVDHTCVSVQGFAANYLTATCDWSYKKTVDGSTTTQSFTYYNTSDNYEPLPANEGSGFSFSLDIPEPVDSITTTTVYSDFTSVVAGVFDNSSVLPNAYFSVYGNYVQKKVAITISLSYPLAVSGSLDTSQYNQCPNAFSIQRVE